MKAIRKRNHSFFYIFYLVIFLFLFDYPIFAQEFDEKYADPPPNNKEIKKNKKAMPLIEDPDFDAPIRLSFHALKKIYAVYRLKGGVFPPVAVEKLNGAAVEISGAVMPVDPVPKSGTLVRFWLANPVVVMAGCGFCNPPTMADLILVTTPFGESPLRINREQLFKSIVMVKMRGRLFFGPNKDGKVEYMFKMDSHEIIPVN